MTAPVIFCHYGNSDYLRYTIRCAALMNPGKQIVLLGDSDNKWIEGVHGVCHRAFSEFDGTQEKQAFDQVFRLIKGRQFDHMKNGRNWVRFAFEKWFYLLGYLSAAGCRDFWFFDSDTMVVSSLEEHQYKFSAYECTEQCNGSCMKGYFSTPDVVRKFTETITSLFRRPEYLKEHQEEFDSCHPTYAFTEMRAYKSFKEEAGLNSVRLNTVIDGSSFDDCICQEHGMVMEALPMGPTIKKVCLEKNRQFVCVARDSGARIRMNSLNLSWVPLCAFARVLDHCASRHRRVSPRARPNDESPTLARSIRASEVLLWRARGSIRSRIRRKLSSDAASSSGT